MSWLMTLAFVTVAPIVHNNTYLELGFVIDSSQCSLASTRELCIPKMYCGKLRCREMNMQKARLVHLFFLLASLNGFGDSPSIQSGWTAKQLSNSVYTIHGHHYKLRDGEYFVNSAEDQTSFEMIQSFTVSGDLNSDGIKDYVVFIFSSYGGSGLFPLAIARLSGPTGWVDTDAFEMPDRVDVQGTAIREGVLILNMRVHGERDGACCPSEKTVWKLRVEGGKLRKFVGRNDG